ncbi:MAG: hypothetical protein RL685_7259, partial [Pseudomonadota bacterium]
MADEFIDSKHEADLFSDHHHHIAIWNEDLLFLGNNGDLDGVGAGDETAEDDEDDWGYLEIERSLRSVVDD